LYEKLTDLFAIFLPRRTFKQLIYKIGLCHLNDVSLHEGRNKLSHEQYYIKKYKMLFSFFFTRSYPKGFLLGFKEQHSLINGHPMGSVMN